MGLDMYLSVRRYISRVDLTKVYDREVGWSETSGFHDLMDSLNAADYLESGETTGSHVEIPVAYWRKANAIHNWFVTERADGVDDCREIGVTDGHLEELLSLCEIVLRVPASAPIHLPTESGFFFGGVEYDDWYFDQISYTAKRLREIIPLMKKNNDDWAVYQASW